MSDRLAQVKRETHFMLVRIKATGQVLDMVPSACAVQLEYGLAERVEEKETKETSSLTTGLREFAARFTGAR